MSLYTIIWITISTIIIVGGIFLLGYGEEPGCNYDRGDDIAQIVFVGVLWPAIVIVALVAASLILPFFGIYKFGKFIGNRKKFDSK